MEESITRVELEFDEWLWKVSEKLTLARLSVQEHKEVGEEFYDIAKKLHPLWYRGELVFYKNVLDLPEQNVTEQGLFSGNSVSETAESVAEKVDGTEIDIPDAETKTEEEND